jgi:hypothetical protein
MIREGLDFPGPLPQRFDKLIIGGIRAPVRVVQEQRRQGLTRSEEAAIGSSVKLCRGCVSGAVGHD